MIDLIFCGPGLHKRCDYCYALPGEQCTTAKGRPAKRTHKVRLMERVPERYNGE